MNVKEFIKTKWQIIVIFILIIFSFSKCTSSCSRNQVIKRQNSEIAVKDSIISAQKHDIEIYQLNQNNLSQQLSSEKSHNSDITGIATGNQKEMAAKIEELTRENKHLKSEISLLKQKVNE